MADSYEVQVIASLLAGAATEWTKTETADNTLTEWVALSSRIAIAAADVNVKLNTMTDPKILVIFGGKGITFKLDSTGVDAIGADPVAVVANEGDGLGIDEILVSNSDAVEHTITIWGCE